MSEMVERVAKALAKQDAIEHELVHPIDWQLYRQNARAAIEAMRMPADNRFMASATWNAMIDEVLSRSP